MAPVDLAVVRSIVMIDDDKDFLHVMRRHLQDQRGEYAPTGPLQIETFTDPVEALVNLPAEGICVVILDYHMPGGSGMEWLPKVLKAGLGPAILLTNHDDAKTAAEAFRAGAADYVAKGDIIADVKCLGRAIRQAVHRYRLEERNTSLTRQLKLVNAELALKNKRLHELSETAHRFVDDVAHDFRTPLTVIEQYASIITDGISGPVTGQQQEHLGIIAEAAQELSGMVGDFLDSSKLRDRSLSVYRESHTLEELMASIEPVLNVRSSTKRITVERNVEGNVGPFFADLSKINRVLSNLAVNAIKATPEGRRLRLWARATEHGDVRIGVTDEGPGLDPADLKIIFNRFQQLGEPYIQGEKGFGLGLSIVKHLAWLNLGTIDVQSELGKGSTFSLTLPAFDPHRILACYLQSIGLLAEMGDLWMLHIRPKEGVRDLSMLRRLISSVCYPMDLVLTDAASKTVHVLGVTGDVHAWVARLSQAVGQADHGITGAKPLELNFDTDGPWSRETDHAELKEVLMEHFHTRSCNA